MIKIEISNLEKIKEFHKCYFDEVVKVNFNEKINDEKVDKICRDFLKKYFYKKYFYSDEQLNEELLMKLCYGDANKLKDIISKYEKLYESYFKSKWLEKLSKYQKYLNSTENGRKKEVQYDRYNNWLVCKNDINNILNKKDSSEFEKDEIVNQIREKLESIGKTKDEILNDEKSKEFSNKGNINKSIEELKENFDHNKHKEILKEILKDIFDYDKFVKNKSLFKIKNKDIVWNRHKLITMMNISVCPYCNRQFINNYVDLENILKTTADLDHFYSKSKYPYLALSLYNFVPSCQICNSRFKSSDDFHLNPHINPHLEGFDKNAKFKTNFYTNSDTVRIENNNKLKNEDKYDINYLLGNSDNFKIEIEIENTENNIVEKIENSVETFKIDKLYNCHKDYVSELIKKAIVYNESRIDELFTEYPDLFKSREEVIQMVVSNYIADEDLGKRPLSKLTKDICEELGIR